MLFRSSLGSTWARQVKVAVSPGFTLRANGRDRITVWSGVERARERERERRSDIRFLNIMFVAYSAHRYVCCCALAIHLYCVFASVCTVCVRVCVLVV